MKQIRLLFVVMMLVLSGYAALAAAGSPLGGDVTVIQTGELEQALGTVIAETQTQLGQGAGVGELFRSPAFLTALLGLLGVFPVFFGTNGLKLSTTWIKGNKTRVLAAILSMITAGLPAYFTVSQVAGVEGPGRIAAAVSAALGALLLAIGKHETDRTRQTGQRHPERKHAPAIPTSPEDLLEIARNSSLALEVRQRAVATLKSLNPLAGAAAEAFLNQFATRPLTPNEGEAERDAERERRQGAQVVTGG